MTQENMNFSNGDAHQEGSPAEESNQQDNANYKLILHPHRRKVQLKQ